MARLREHSREDVPAVVRVGTSVWERVAVHVKGSKGSFRPIDQKPSLTLDFSKWNSGQTFHSLTKLHLNNSVEDPSYLKEQLGSELFQAAQLPVPRLGHVPLELNGTALGLYVLKEGYTEEFVARHFNRAGGNLYDTDLGHDVHLRMQRHLGYRSDSDQADLQRLCGALQDPDPARRWTRLQEALDLDRFLTFMAMEVIICHWDGYCLGQNNFRLYHDLASDRIVFLPCGMDQLFSKPDMPWQPDMSGLVARAVMDIPEGRARYGQRFRSLLDSVLQPEKTTNRVHQMVSALRPLSRGDQFAQITREAEDLCEAVIARRRSLDEQLGQPDPVVPQFSDGSAPLKDWQLSEITPGNSRTRGQSGSEPWLALTGGTNRSASWRTVVRLNPGLYRFRGEAKVTGVTPLGFGKHHGASLRVVGRPSRSSALTGTGPWRPLEAEFTVTAPSELVVLICELRSESGHADFRKDSLKLLQEEEGSAEALALSGQIDR